MPVYKLLIYLGIDIIIHDIQSVHSNIHLRKLFFIQRIYFYALHNDLPHGLAKTHVHVCQK